MFGTPNFGDHYNADFNAAFINAEIEDIIAICRDLLYGRMSDRKVPNRDRQYVMWQTAQKRDGPECQDERLYSV